MWSQVWNYTMESARINIWYITEDKDFPTPRIYQLSIVQQRGVKSHEPLHVCQWLFDRPCLVQATIAAMRSYLQWLSHVLKIGFCSPSPSFWTLIFFPQLFQPCSFSCNGGINVLCRAEHWTAIQSKYLKSHETAFSAVHYKGEASLRMRVEFGYGYYKAQTFRLNFSDVLIQLSHYS